MEIFYIGYVFNEATYYENSALSFAAGRFELGLLNGLINNGANVRIISIEPRSNRFPKDIFYVKKKFFSLFSNNDSESVGYINFPFLKHFCVFDALKREIRRWKKETKNKSRIILSYNADVPIIQFGLKQEKKGIPYIPILSDIPFYFDGKKANTFKRKLSLLGYKSQYKNLCKLKQAVVLNNNTAQDFRISNSLLIEGAISNEEKERYVDYEKTHDKTVLYCGSLDEFHGIDRLLEVIAICNDIHFIICGRGKEWTDKIQNFALNSNNLSFYGEIDNTKMYDLQKQSSLLIVPHPTELKQLRYQFPSKLLSYMSTGIPVLTTPLPGITDEYKNYLKITNDDTPKCIASSISDFFKKSIQERKKVGERAREFVVCYKNWDTQASKIIRFANSILEKKLAK